MDDPLTSKIINAAYEVHNELGPGFLEQVHHNAMKITLSERGLNLLSEEKVEVRFRKKPVGPYFADLIIENSVVVEIKSTARLAPEHSAQTINYLKAGSLKQHCS